ncbi:helix-turn-helix domain-containing protein [Cohnella sp. CFH 77786]|uniref:helix-turn-helix domain-containing protein n=1 Tax=Cohnella sp. CFH 77786 TaxID=2662265 RepID=UPI001C609E58|nr:helix-turn-helix domain-containing protein [Cohnella sp. CFH 77786]
MARKSQDAQRIKNAVGQRLQGFRNHQGRTQEDVAHEADVHPSYITKLESGRSNWTIESLDNVLNALHVSYSDLFYNIDESKNKIDNSVLIQIVKLLEGRSIEEQRKALQLLKTLYS